MADIDLDLELELELDETIEDEPTPTTGEENATTAATETAQVENAGTNVSEDVGMNFNVVVEGDLEVDSCDKNIKSHGMFFDIANTSVRYPGVLIGSPLSISLFDPELNFGDDPLVQSIDVNFIDEIRLIEGAPGCIQIGDSKEDKDINFCWTPVN